MRDATPTTRIPSLNNSLKQASILSLFCKYRSLCVVLSARRYITQISRCRTLGVERICTDQGSHQTSLTRDTTTTAMTTLQTTRHGSNNHFTNYMTTLLNSSSGSRRQQHCSLCCCALGDFIRVYRASLNKSKQDPQYREQGQQFQ